MIAAADKNGVKFMVHQNRRWDSDYLTAKAIYDSKQIGNIYHIESRISGSNGIPKDWRCTKASGGGMLYDWGVHMLDQILMMVKSNVKSVECNLSYRQGAEVDDGFIIRLTFENGSTAFLDFETNDFCGVMRWRLLGEDGTAAYNWLKYGKMIRVKDKIDSNIKPVQVGNGITKTIAPRTKKSIKRLRIKRTYFRKWDSFYKGYYDYVVNDGPPIIKTSENLRVLKVIDAAFLSHAQEKRIDISI